MRYKLMSNLNTEKPTIEEIFQSHGLDMNKFLNVNEEVLISPFALSNIEEGIKCLVTHLERESKICLIVDSDTDGYTSAAIFYQYVKRLYPKANIVVATHTGKQHGIIMDAIEEDTGLVVVPDASSGEYEKHSELKARGIDVLVIDHHEAPELSKDAIVINNQLSPAYPNKAFSGAGVTYKFCKALDMVFNVDYADDYIDLVALGLVADMMNTTSLETRYYIKEGLKNIQNEFFMALLQKQAYSISNITTPTITDISFYIAPLINAIVRAGSPEERELMFWAFVDGGRIVPSTKRGARGETESLATQMARNCVNARARQNRKKDKLLEKVIAKIEEEKLYNNKIMVVTFEENELDEEDKNLTGLLAMQLLNIYKRPALFLHKSGDCYKGSGRGSDKFELTDLRQFLEDSEMFEYVAGHSNAFGVSIKEDELNNFIESANRQLAETDFSDGIYEVSYISTIDTLDPNIIFNIADLAHVWGFGIEEPLLAITDITLNKADISFIGSKKDTVKFSREDITFIKFKDQEMVDHINSIDAEKVVFEVVGRANLNEWNGSVTPQIIIVDYNLKPVESGLRWEDF